MRDPDANERLTAVAAVPLFVLLAVEGITLLAMGPLLPVHVFVGLLLVLPLAAKIASTGWRFVRYYRRDEEYVRRGPPRLLLRLLAPLLVGSSVSILATGIALVFTHGHWNLLLLLHKASFIVWVPAFGVHVLAYVWRVPRLVLASTWLQRFAIVGVVGVACVLAVAGYADGHPTLHPFFDGDADAF
jgi:uncharacterized membrane protein (UPF0182 family)